ncbi:hypothetical protein J3E07_001457 [Methanococcus voltae]|uniref:Uncharacterized protein n=1 Tax=Methanococcus voltae TaxID=2188 RepID=A0A8J7RJG8_METVO|nr:hypothetical protein [Methanococcus voltae]MBP2202016.1 hypothetical protein [Methanococcus voltae]
MNLKDTILYKSIKWFFAVKSEKPKNYDTEVKPILYEQERRGRRRRI